ncbi:MAG TPA: tRNA (guanosine(37)-N1)-methyltransferase TrmD [Marinagarivorans sp.]
MGTALHIGIVTLFPEMFRAITDYGVTRRAVSDGIVDVRFFNPRDYTTDKHRTVDDRPYGGGPGMVMRVEPLLKAVTAAKEWQHEVAGCAGQVVYMSPQGQRLNQAGVKTLSDQRNLILVAGRYEGVDERFIQTCVDQEWSIGDYVVSGGELPAMVLLDAVMRMLPGVLGDASSASQDSFEYGLLDCPHYTRPEAFNGMGVPEALMSGDHQRIAQWRLTQSLGRTQARRPDLLCDMELDEAQKALLDEYRKGLKID